LCQCNGFVLHIKPFSIKLWFQKMNHLKNKTKRDVDDNEFLHLKWCNQYFAYTHKSSNTLWMSNKRFSFFLFLSAQSKIWVSKDICIKVFLRHLFPIFCFCFLTEGVLVSVTQLPFVQLIWHSCVMRNRVTPNDILRYFFIQKIKTPSPKCYIRLN
jgi:hypothetical protein